MSDKIRRFTTLERLAGAKELTASQRLAKQRADVEAKEAELSRLREYLREYQEPPSPGLPPARWENYRRFVSKLSFAIQQQETELADAHRRLREEAEKWHACHAQTKALDQLLETYQRDERREFDRKEQQENDERQSRRSR